jgi:hypothetical protein
MVYTPNQPNVASHGSWVDMENLREMIDRQTDIDMWARKRCTASTIPFHPSQRWLVKVHHPHSCRFQQQTIKHVSFYFPHLRLYRSNHRMRKMQSTNHTHTHSSDLLLASSRTRQTCTSCVSHTHARRDNIVCHGPTLVLSIGFGCLCSLQLVIGTTTFDVVDTVIYEPCVL